MKDQASFFEFAAEVGLTKHIGGVEATDTLMRVCHIDQSSDVLDVGCGVGVTPCYLAKKVGCRVIGVDILEGMVEKSRERAEREGVANQVEFKRADAQELPFPDNTFDAVITESVTAFPADKQKAVREYVRVTKPGGHIGLNESTWLKTPPPPDLIAWVAQDVGANVSPLTPDEWRGLLETVGARDIIVDVRPVDIRDESKGILRRYGLGSLLTSVWKMLLLYIKNPAYRQFVREIKKQGVTPKSLDEYFGYGLYVGRKPDSDEG